jgi:hypothetical protein
MKNGDDLHQIVAHGMDHQNWQTRHGAFRTPVSGSSREACGNAATAATAAHFTDRAP